MFVCNHKSVIFPFSPDSNRECREEQQEGEKKECKKKWEGAKKIPNKKPGKKEEMQEERCLSSWRMPASHEPKLHLS